VSLGLVIALGIWIIYPIWTSLNFFNIRIVIFFCLSRLRVYPLLRSGWASNSKYRLLGAYRAAAQAISYEVSIIICLLGICFLSSRLNLQKWRFIQNKIRYILMVIPTLCIWLIICLAETNRSPFDFREGESELVSGFNTEYRGGYFSIIFISEYTSILFLRILTSSIFLSSLYIIRASTLLIASIFIWIRGTLPRTRYDKLIIIAWKGLLPLVLGVLSYSFSLPSSQ
jgi:NADH-ubiquinone oxidoreductase chain 1